MKRLVILFATALAAATPAASQPDAPADAPAEPVSTPPEGTRVVLRGVKFGFDTAYIEPVSEGTLQVVAEEILKRPGIRVRVEGHTDEAGGEAYNDRLSQERAEAVKRILVGFGVPPEQLEAKGFGESRPLAPNDTREGRAMNRRVELVVVD